MFLPGFSSISSEALTRGTRLSATNDSCLWAEESPAQGGKRSSSTQPGDPLVSTQSF